MASVYKPTYTRTIPQHAELVVVKGMKVYRWRGRGGKQVIGRPSVRGRCIVESFIWWIKYRDHLGEERLVKGYTDKGATEAKLASLVKQAAMIDAGLLPPEAARPKRTLDELLTAWSEHMADKGSSAAHVARQLNRGRAVAAGVRMIVGSSAIRPSDLTPVRVQRWIAEQCANSELRFGAAVASHYIGAIKAFTRWLVRIEKAEPLDHLSGLTRPADETDPRYLRRVLSPPDFATLIKTTKKSVASFAGLTGPERAMLYRFASTTGLRAEELSSLTPLHFELDLDPPIVTLEAKRSKRGTEDELPLLAAIVADLRKYIGRLGPNDRLWPDRRDFPSRAWWKRGAPMIAADLKAAGIPFKLEGRVYDFHALRSQFATDLERAGVPLSRAQKLLRHSSPTLTQKHYTRPENKEMAADLNRLGRK
jgi:integrase